MLYSIWFPFPYEGLAYVMDYMYCIAFSKNLQIVSDESLIQGNAKIYFVQESI